ncbi:SLC13 family permease [Actinopolyspora saharensis]|uniref:Dicarboxylate carrier protein MatC N-terminus n=1 Tax=Actinopolyspora saharensis TaxID=995062 RepID=A0A1H0YRI2_9ACTN|nr:SLC13 family permease [Actinopolyspora saharensis]SDQ17740.1 Dicarboxylate carrier protein MatC N-terminus [Actinopolyspora saharensis]
MSPELISILALVVAFVVTTTLSVNMGMLMLAMAFLVGTAVAGLSTDQIFAGFPGDLFVVLVGVTYLFAIARANGTIDWIVRGALRLVGGRIALIPWIMFTIGAVLTAVGAVSPAACAIVAPIAMSMAARYRINPLLMGAMVVHGTQAGSFSPISIYGTIVNGVVARAGLPASPIVLFLGALAVNVLIAGVVFVLFGGLRLARSGSVSVTTSAAEPALSGVAAGARESSTPSSTGGVELSSTHPGADEPALGGETSQRLTGERVATLLGLVALVVATLGFEVNVGLAAVTVAVVLSVVSPGSARNAPSEVAWPTVLLISGVLTYVGVLKEMGTIDYAGAAVAGVGIPLVVALLLCYVGGVVSAFASSVGIMGALIPLAVPFLQQGQIGAVGMITALAVASTVVDVSPFSTNGAIVLANASGFDRDALFRKLLVYGGVVVVAAPVLSWLLFVVLPGLG